MTTWIAIWTMLISPVALGREAQRATKQQLQNVLSQMGLNKKMTLGQFYQKNEHLYPDRIKNKIKPFFQKFKNQPMPTYEIITSKATTGEDVPVIRGRQGTELLNVQWFGEPNRMFKFQNVNITEIDLINFDDMIERILASDAKLRKNIDPRAFKNKSQIVAKKKDAKYPDITKAEWKSMSPQDRAQYVVNLRLLLQDARQVLKNKPSIKKTVKTSQNFIESNRYFFSLILGQRAFAEENTDIGKSCIAAGYVTEYEAAEGAATGKKCSASKIDELYGKDKGSLYTKAKDVCSSSKIKDPLPCNPYIYGTPNGQPICISASLNEKNFQNSTHFEGYCDSRSRLSDPLDKVQFLKNDKIEGSARYEANNLKHKPEELKNILKKQQGENQKLTEEYLLGLLKFQNKIKSDVKTLSEVMSEDILNIIKKDKAAFDQEIAKATKICKESTTTKHESNYLGACDQLHRRFLFVDDLFQSKCSDSGLDYNKSTMKCSCSPSTGGVGETTEAVPGAQCSAAVQAVESAAASSVVSEAASQDETATALLQDSTAGNKVEKVVVNDGIEERKDGIHLADDEDDDLSNGSFDNKCGFGCKSWKFTKTAAPYLVTGALIAGMVYAMSPKKPKRHFAGDQCPNGKPAPCAQICSYPLKLQSTGLCSCDGCPPTQSADPMTCFCSAVSSGMVGMTQIFTCPDSITQVEDLATCPDYPCWNGSTYKNPMNCPTQQPTVPSETNVGQ